MGQGLVCPHPFLPLSPAFLLVPGHASGLGPLSEGGGSKWGGEPADLQDLSQGTGQGGGEGGRFSHAEAETWVLSPPSPLPHH